MSLLRIALVGLALTFVGCLRLDTHWDLESQGDLAGRRTFSLQAISDRPGELSDVPLATWQRRHEMVRARILTALTEKGYRHSISAPDFAVYYNGGLEPVDGAFSHNEGEIQGKIDIHAEDPTTHRWLWHGWSQETLVRRLERDASIQKAVAEILSKFPPAS